MLKTLKQTTLRGLKIARVLKLLENSNWRKGKLLILAYHGISMDDEHLWDPTLFMTPTNFRARMRVLKDSSCTVLPLEEAIKRLYANDLPHRAVALTFDDGLYDFLKCAYPILSEFNFPATLYLTTFYSYYNRPVFDVACSYLLWKGRDRTLDPGALTGTGLKLALNRPNNRALALNGLQTFVQQKKFSAEEKDAFASNLAERLGVNYEEICSKRILNLLNPDEVKRLAADGVNFQLHTHRHRTPLDRSLFQREIDENRKSIREMTGLNSEHFCYPSGVYHTDFLPWLAKLGVDSATTCDPGLASTTSNRMLLPRLVDTSVISPIEFEGWLTGAAALLPHRTRAIHD